ncbi:MAG: hypothetical protein H7X83_08165 [Verrucomicrobia bacterium]|nr:hypothetical protein [Deltaproteobacteria bacterium]
MKATIPKQNKSPAFLYSFQMDKIPRKHIKTSNGRIVGCVYEGHVDAARTGFRLLAA